MGLWQSAVSQLANYFVKIGAGRVTIDRPGGLDAHWIVQAEGTNVMFWALKFFTGIGGPMLVTSKANGTIASPAAVATNAQAGRWIGQLHDGTTFQNAVVITLETIAVAPSSTDMESQLRVSLCAPGSVIPTDVLRVSHRNGLQVWDGAQWVTK